MRPCSFYQQVKTPEEDVLECFSFRGVGSDFPVQGMIQSYQYIKVVIRRVVPDMLRAFPNRGAFFSSIYHPAIVKKKSEEMFFRQQHLNFKLARYPSDINPIEKLWAIIKRRLLEHDNSTLIKLDEAAIAI